MPSPCRQWQQSRRATRPKSCWLPRTLTAAPLQVCVHVLSCTCSVVSSAAAFCTPAQALCRCVHCSSTVNPLKCCADAPCSSLSHTLCAVCVCCLAQPTLPWCPRAVAPAGAPWAPRMTTRTPTRETPSRPRLEQTPTQPWAAPALSPVTSPCSPPPTRAHWPRRTRAQVCVCVLILLAQQIKAPQHLVHHTGRAVQWCPAAPSCLSVMHGAQASTACNNRCHASPLEASARYDPMKQ